MLCVCHVYTNLRGKYCKILKKGPFVPKQLHRRIKESEIRQVGLCILLMLENRHLTMNYEVKGRENNWLKGTGVWRCRGENVCK